MPRLCRFLRPPARISGFHSLAAAGSGITLALAFGASQAKPQNDKGSYNNDSVHIGFPTT
jgi:hypothetical protein